MGNITFEQLPQAVSTLIERVEQLARKVDEVLGTVSYTHLTLPTTERV